MKLLHGLLGIAAIVVLSFALTAVAVLSRLDGRTDFAVEPLVRGDLGGLFASRTVWRAFPALPDAAGLLAFGPAATVLLLSAVVLAAARRWRHVPTFVWPAVALAIGVVPYAIGAVALRGNALPQATGGWLVWMLLGPAYAAVASLLLLGHSTRRGGRAARRIGHPVAMVS